MKVISTTEAAKRLGVTANRVRALIDAKRLKATKFGNVWMIDPKDLEAVKSRKPGRPRKTKKRQHTVPNRVSLASKTKSQ